MPRFTPLVTLLGPDFEQNFVSQISAIPNLKLDYVVINAGVLRYPNVSSHCLSSFKGQH